MGSRVPSKVFVNKSEIEAALHRHLRATAHLLINIRGAGGSGQLCPLALKQFQISKRGSHGPGSEAFGIDFHAAEENAAVFAS